MGRLEDEPGRSTKVKRVLSTTNPCQRVKATSRATHVRERRGRHEHREAPPDDGPLLVAEATNPGAVGRAVLGEPSVGP